MTRAWDLRPLGDLQRRIAGPITVTVALFTVAVSAVGLVVPAVLTSLQRLPDELADGQAYRVLTSLLVHDNWLALASNLILLVVIGGAAERSMRPWWWFASYLLGGITGELAGLAWEPTGAGNSVAILGLLGALAVLALGSDVEEPAALGLGVIVLMTLAVADLGVGAVGTVVAASVLGSGCVTWGRRRGARGLPPLPTRPIAASAMLCALVLIALHDIHGPATLAGAAGAAGLLVWRGHGRDTPSTHR